MKSLKEVRPDRFRSLTTVNETENDSTVCYFNKVRYLVGMNNQLILPRTEKLFYFKITSS
jgi:hypothetical protein